MSPISISTMTVTMTLAVIVVAAVHHGDGSIGGHGRGDSGRVVGTGGHGDRGQSSGVDIGISCKDVVTRILWL